MAETTKKGNWMKRHPVWMGVIALVILAVIVSPKSVKEGYEAGQGRKSEPVTTDDNTPQVTTGSQNNDTPPAQENKAKEWVEVATISGKTDKMSETFALTGGKVRVSYDVTGGSMCMTIIYLEKAGTDIMTQGGLPVVTVAEAMSDSSLINKAAGEYEVQVKNANCEYSIKVEEER